MNIILKKTRIDLTCEKILDFSIPLQYIHPEILFGLSLLFGTTMNRYLAKSPTWKKNRRH